MERATVSELKNHLSAYLRKVRAGETVLIIDRNEPVARLERIERHGRGDDRLTRLQREGLVRPSSMPIPLEMLHSPAPKAKQSVLGALLEERRSGR